MGEDDATFIEIGDRLVDHLERDAGLQRESSVLDIGCGYGRVAHALLRHGYRGRYLGIDVLAPHIDWCAANLGSDRMRFRRLDIHNERYNPGGKQTTSDLELDPERFDVVALFSVFTHMWPEDVIGYLRLIASTLAPRGRALATFFLLDDEWRRLEANGSATFRLPFERTAFCRYGSEDEPLHRVGYELDWVVSTARKAGLRALEPPAFGAWSGRRNAVGYQDMVILMHRSQA